MKSNSDTRKPYSGSVRSLVLAIDVGTTFSGVSYAILEPGEVPKIHGVTRFPGQEHVAGNCKIPSILWYDASGKMVAAGAEAETSTNLSQAEDEEWTKVELFKLRLRPRTMQLNMNGMRLGRLPPGKTAVDVFGDFLAYLFLCTRNFITDTHANGGMLWATVEHDIKFVLSHPNGWEGAQQSKLRRSAIHGGLVPNTSAGKARVFFVTEGEASLHACVLNGLAADVLSDPLKPGFLIADAGGGTWDISAYSITGQNPLLIEEIAPPDCIFAGSVFVSRRARKFLEEKLESSRYGSPEAVEHITRRFDETTKRLFRDDRSLQFISFGSPLDKDPTVGIRGGQLKLTGAEVRELFEPSIEDAFNAVKAQIDGSAGVIKSVWLVGGFAANHWLFSQLQERLAPYNVTVNRPDSQTSKAVCDGAVGFYVDHYVSVRMSKAFYGVEFLRTFDPEDPEHVQRESTLCELPSGPKLLPDAFDCILKRGVKVKESTIFSRKYSTELTSLNVLSVFEVLIWCYRGKGEVPTWIYRDAEEFSTLCIVRADLSPLKGSAVPQTGVNGKTFWKIIFSVEIHFGLTEFRARIKWVDNGEIKYGPASIVYNERGRRVEEDEPDAFPEDDMTTIVSSRSDRMRSPPPLSRPHSYAAGPPEDRTPIADTVPEVARLPDELQEPRRGTTAAAAETGTSSRHSNRETSRGRKSGKGKGKGKEKEKEITPEESADSRTSSALADTLRSVWGKEPSASRSRSVDVGTPAGIGEIEGPQPGAEPATDAAQAPQAPPEQTEAAKVPSAPRTPKVDAAPELDAVQTPTAPNAPEVPATIDASKVPTAPPTPKVDASPELDTSQTPTTPSAPEVPATVDASKVPTAPPTPKADASPELDASQTPTAPSAPKVPATIDASKVPTAPPTPKVDASPELDASQTPTAPSAPEVPAAQTEEASPPAEEAENAPAPHTPAEPTQESETSTTLEPTAPAEVVAQDGAEVSASSPSAAEKEEASKPEDMKVPSSPAKSQSPEMQTEENSASADAPVENENNAADTSAPQAGRSSQKGSRNASKKTTPLASPTAAAQPLAELTGPAGDTSLTKSSPHTLLLPELIALPASGANSPKSAASPKPHSSPLGISGNAVLPAELSGAAPSRPPPR